jgi:hypothetical protein
LSKKGSEKKKSRKVNAQADKPQKSIQKKSKTPHKETRYDHRKPPKFHHREAHRESSPKTNLEQTLNKPTLETR